MTNNKAIKIEPIQVFKVNKEENFKCKQCGHTLPIGFCMRTPNYCYICDPNITVEELILSDNK